MSRLIATAYRGGYAAISYFGNPVGLEEQLDSAHDTTALAHALVTGAGDHTLHPNLHRVYRHADEINATHLHIWDGINWRHIPHSQGA